LVSISLTCTPPPTTRVRILSSFTASVNNDGLIREYIIEQSHRFYGFPPDFFKPRDLVPPYPCPNRTPPPPHSFYLVVFAALRCTEKFCEVVLHHSICRLHRPPQVSRPFFLDPPPPNRTMFCPIFSPSFLADFSTRPPFFFSFSVPWSILFPTEFSAHVAGRLPSIMIWLGQLLSPPLPFPLKFYTYKLGSFVTWNRFDCC